VRSAHVNPAARITIEPDIAVPYSSADYFSDRDPVLAAALRTPVGR
jgi:hypothetical protein